MYLVLSVHVYDSDVIAGEAPLPRGTREQQTHYCDYFWLELSMLKTYGQPLK